MIYNSCKDFYNKKNTLVTFVTVIMIVLVSFFSAHQYEGLWGHFSGILGYSNIFLFLSLIFDLNSVLFYKNNNQVFVLNRYKTKKEYLKEYTKNILLLNTILYVAYIIISFSVALIFSYLTFDTYDVYGINIILYLAIYIIKNYFVLMITSLISAILINENKIFYNLLIILITFVISFFPYKIIGGFYNITSLFSIGTFNCFITEIIVTIIYLVVLFGIFNLLLNVLSKKKGDINV